MIIDGKQFKWVPVEATTEMFSAANSVARVFFDFMGRSSVDNVEEIVNAAIAAAPAPPVVEVTSETCQQLWIARDEWVKQILGRFPDYWEARSWVAAVQSILGPQMGMVTREEMAREVEAAYREGHGAGELGRNHCEYEWPKSAAKKRLEGGR